MNINLDEKAEDLGFDNLKIIQSANEYRFTTDAVLLANLVADQTGKTVCDLGTGSGIIAVLVSAKKNAKKVVGVELQPQLCDMAQRTVQLNGLSDKIQIVNCAMQDAYKTLGSSFDTVVCNPPYRKLGSGEKQLQPNIAICRHEVAVTLSEVVESASKLLNSKGSFYLVHQSLRLAEIIYEMKKYGLEAKDVYPISPRVGAEPNLVVVRAVKFGNAETKLHKTIDILDQDGNYTPTVAKFYFGEK